MPFELPQDIAATIPPEHLGHQAVAKYNSVGDFIKGHIDAQEHIGRSIVMPNGQSKPEDFEKWAGEQSAKLKDKGYGITKLSEPPPESPDKYDFKVEGYTSQQLNEDVAVKAFRDFAHKEGMNNGQANKLMEFYAKTVAPAIFNEFHKSDIPWVSDPKEIETIFTDEFKQEATLRREEANRAIAELSKIRPSLADTLKDAAASYGSPKKDMSLLNNPDMIWMLSEFARANFSQDFGGHVGTAVVDKDADTEINDIMYNKANPKHELFIKGDKATKEYLSELHKRTTGGK
jgi:hypothetical protein